VKGKGKGKGKGTEVRSQKPEARRKKSINFFQPTNQPTNQLTHLTNKRPDPSFKIQNPKFKIALSLRSFIQNLKFKINHRLSALSPIPSLTA
jgi:hypothetical protein